MLCSFPGRVQDVMFPVSNSFSKSPRKKDFTELKFLLKQIFFDNAPIASTFWEILHLWKIFCTHQISHHNISGLNFGVPLSKHCWYKFCWYNLESFRRSSRLCFLIKFFFVASVILTSDIEFRKKFNFIQSCQNTFNLFAIVRDFAIKINDVIKGPDNKT